MNTETAKHVFSVGKGKMGKRERKEEHRERKGNQGRERWIERQRKKRREIKGGCES